MIEKERAAEIVKERFGKLYDISKAHTDVPGNVYCRPTVPCWIFYINSVIEYSMLKPSYIVMVSKATGQLLYEGSANDEG